jgi:hypothetical protein
VLTVVGTPDVLPEGAVPLGAVASTAPVSVDAVLRPRRTPALGIPAAMAPRARAGSTRRYLARGTFARQFGGDPAAVAELRSVAAAAGVAATPATDGLIVTLTGTASRVERLFHTRLRVVRLADGSLGRVTTAPSELPRALAGSVTAVVGLDELVQRHAASLAYRAGQGPGLAASADRTATAGVAQAGTGPKACPAAQADGGSGGVLTDDAVANLYGVDGLFAGGADGQGQTVDIYELDPFASSDIAAFDTCYFGATAAAAMAGRLHVIPVDGGQTAGPGAGEAALDIENISALAPAATIDVYEAPNTVAGSLDEFGRIVADDNASVVSTSAGLCEAAMATDEPGVQQVENLLFEQAAAQGQTVVAASGDSGSSDCGTDGARAVPPALAVDDPASQPYVLAVGGTSVTAGSESAWGGVSGGGGGGLSRTWTAPGWQVDSGVAGVADPAVLEAAHVVSGSGFCGSRLSACREVPDVSATADPAAGALTVVYDGRWTAAGGTSSSAPLWAAMLADTASSSACAGTVLGFVPPLLYRVASDPTAYAESFHDVTTGSNAVVARAHGLFPATVGYDMATGLGTPMLTGSGGAPGLAEALCAAAATARPTVDSLQPDQVPAASGTMDPDPVVTVHGSGFEDGSGTPIVTSVTIGGHPIPVSGDRRSSVTVDGPGVLSVRVPSSITLAAHGGGGDGTGGYQVVVTTLGGASSAPGPSSLLHYVATSAGGTIATVSAVGPTGGPTAGGDTVTVYGAGFGSAIDVDIGSVPSPSFHVISDDQLTATVPPEGPHTVCATSTDPVDDVCQTQVVVVTAAGASAAASILPPFQGTIVRDADGGISPPTDCGCETAPAATEYDYLPTPRVSSVTAATGADGRQYVSAFGRTPMVVRGIGLGLLGYLWTDTGPPGEATSVDTGLLSVSPTQVVVSSPLPPTGADLPLTLPVSVQTLASPNRDALGSVIPPSNSEDVVVAPTPAVTAVRDGTSRVAGPTTGGTRLRITGYGFASARSVLIVDQVAGAPSLATVTDVSVHGSTLDLVTPAADTGRDDVLVCSITACSPADPSVDTFTYYPPGDPTLSSGRHLRGPADGGTDVVLTGADLSWVIGVRFGSVQATVFANRPGTDDGGSPTSLTVVAPPGNAGTTVPIRVETLASAMDGSHYSPVVPTVVFTYRAH